jgi:threonylcarbamoyladenosine tRNA methylthiotransferase MtaB
MKFFVHTTGCKANQWDSHVIAERLKGAGLSHGSMADADIIVVNACSLTARAEADARRFVQAARRTNLKARIALVGCQAQAYPDRDFGADVVLGQEDKFQADRYLAGAGRFVREGRHFPIEQAPVNGPQRGRTRFFFKIQDGCNRFCSYCLVPYARGAARSRPLDEIVSAFGCLHQEGIKEVVLTGIDIAAYRDPVTGKDLADLLGLLDGVDTPSRIRLSSVDPDYIDDRFIGALCSSKKLSRSIHIPAQSGCDRVLAAMGRRHRAEFTKALVEGLTSAVKDIGIGMDIMVGFPGEDDEAFEETYRFVEGLDVFYLHVFPFSPREGTRAFAMDGAVPERVKRDRVRRLKVLDGQKRDAFSRRFLGRRLSIIPEGRLYPGDLMKGFSDNYLPVYLPYEKKLENNLVNVTIMGLKGSRLMGEC